MFVFVWILILVYFHQTLTGYVEIVETAGCNSCKLLLTCRHLDSVIAILGVNFVPDRIDEIVGNNSLYSAPFPPAYPRDILNQRCSGVNHCSFILSKDCPGSENFGQGNITIKYACITEDRIKKYCNSEIVLPKKYTTGLSEGFIHNPGYPRFYSGRRQCRWRITAQAQQKIRLTVLDISLIVDNVNSQTECTDVLEIKDTGQVIHSACHQEHPPTEILSGSESIEVVLSSKQEFNPRRGVLLYYTVVGCLELPVPHDAYVVYRNDEVTVFSCCLGYQFPDTGARTKSVSCLGASWNTSLPLLDCQESPIPPRFNQTIDLLIKQRKSPNMASDLLAPALIIVALFIINGGVLFFIYKAKKKQLLVTLTPIPIFIQVYVCASSDFNTPKMRNSSSN